MSDELTPAQLRVWMSFIEFAMTKHYPEWLREAAAKGGKKSRRKLTKKQAREMVKARESKRAAGVALKPCEHDGARSTTVRSEVAP